MPYSSQYGAQSLDDAWHSVHTGRQKEVIKLGTSTFLVMDESLKIPVHIIGPKKLYDRKVVFLYNMLMIIHN